MQSVTRNNKFIKPNVTHWEQNINKLFANGSTSVVYCFIIETKSIFILFIIFLLLIIR